MSQWNVSVFLYRISHFYLLSHPDPPSITCVSIPHLLLLLKMQLIPCKQHNSPDLTPLFCLLCSHLRVSHWNRKNLTGNHPESTWKLKGANAHWMNLWPGGPRSWWMPFPLSFFWMNCSGFPVMASMIPHPHIFSDLHHYLTTLSIIHASQLD